MDDALELIVLLGFIFCLSLLLFGALHLYVYLHNRWMRK